MCKSLHHRVTTREETASLTYYLGIRADISQEPLQVMWSFESVCNNNLFIISAKVVVVCKRRIKKILQHKNTSLQNQVSNPLQAIMNSTKVVIPLHYISWKKTPNDAVTPQRQSQFTPKMIANAVPRLLSSLVWIDRYKECNGMTSFMEFMLCLTERMISE